MLKLYFFVDILLKIRTIFTIHVPKGSLMLDWDQIKIYSMGAGVGGYNIEIIFISHYKLTIIKKNLILTSQQLKSNHFCLLDIVMLTYPEPTLKIFPHSMTHLSAPTTLAFRPLPGSYPITSACNSKHIHNVTFQFSFTNINGLKRTQMKL